MFELAQTLPGAGVDFKREKQGTSVKDFEVFRPFQSDRMIESQNSGCTTTLRARLDL